MAAAIDISLIRSGAKVPYRVIQRATDGKFWLADIEEPTFETYDPGHWQRYAVPYDHIAVDLWTTTLLVSSLVEDERYVLLDYDASADADGPLPSDNRTGAYFFRPWGQDQGKSPQVRPVSVVQSGVVRPVAS